MKHRFLPFLPLLPWLPYWPWLPVWRWFSAGCLGLMLVACSSSPLSASAEMLRAERTIARAEQDRVGQYAASELAEARQKMQASRSALLLKDTVRADRLAEQASLDAELAMARADLAKANRVNEEMSANGVILQQEMLHQTQGIQP